MTRSKNYLKHIRSLPCLRCQTYGTDSNPIEACHESLGDGVVSGKPSDIQTYPLHAKCHREEHHVGKLTFWGGLNGVELKSFLAYHMLRYLDSFISDGGKF